MWWENELLSRREGQLFLGGRPATEVAARFGTPLFVYSRPQILANYSRLARAFEASPSLKTRIFYAMKANPHPGVLRVIRRRGGSIDAVSPGEVEAARRSGFPGSRILFTGTSVSTGDLRRVFGVDGVTVNIDALEQLELMREVRDREFAGKKIRVSVRWNPGVGRGFNPKVVTAGVCSTDGTPIKFGLEEGSVPLAFERAREYGFKAVGLHQHLGSGWTREDFPSVREAVEKLVRLAARLEKAGLRLEFLDFGGGIGPRYQAGHKLFPLEDYARFVGRRIVRAGLKVGWVAVEPGKFLLADAGVLLVRVEYVKTSHGQVFACVNAGTYTSLPRPAIYAGARHEILNCAKLGARLTVPVTVAGNLCETGDVFGRQVPLPEPRRGDILAILHAGAYARSMASNFNLRENPREILI
jgi:diaminopimelate decarboxylase